MSNQTFANQFREVPYIDQYVGVWAMYEPTFQALFDSAMRLNIHEHLKSDALKELSRELADSGDRAANQYRTKVQDSVAIIRASGTLMKHASSFTGGTSTTLLRRAINVAASDDNVGSILLAIDSPGGTAAGTYELADTIAKADTKKPVFAHVDDLGASAAYWIASASRGVSANAPAKIGSIGTYAVIHDLSAMAAKEGVKVHVVRAGSEFKGAGVPGTEITASQLGEFQRLVDQVNQFFLEGVSKGRKMPMTQVKQVADGRVHIAADAKSLGLIDNVRSFEESFLEAAKVAASKSTKSHVRGTRMSQTETEKHTSVATASEIEAACPGASSEFVLNSLKAGRSLDQCRDAFVQDLATELAAAKEQIDTLTTENADMKSQVEKAKETASGVDPLIDDKSGKKPKQSESASDAFWAAVKEEVAEGKSRSEALAAVNRRSPELREAMLAETRATKSEA